MFTNRLTRTAAIALAIAAAAAPAASARPIEEPAATQKYTLPHDFRSADARGTDQPQQDLRSADTRDYAEGRGTYNAPEVVVVDVPQPVAQPTAGGIDWQDVGLGGALAIVHRRGARELA